MLIVKKMPILQGFPDFETVKNLSGKDADDVNFSPVFYDIETKFIFFVFNWCSLL